MGYLELNNCEIIGYEIVNDPFLGLPVLVPIIVAITGALAAASGTAIGIASLVQSKREREAAIKVSEANTKTAAIIASSQLALTEENRIKNIETGANIAGIAAVGIPVALIAFDAMAGG